MPCESRNDRSDLVPGPSQFADRSAPTLSDIRTPCVAGDAMVTIHKTFGNRSDVGAVRRELENDHVHMVLVVDRGRRLLTTITRSDLPLSIPDTTEAISVGRLAGRTTRPSTPIIDITARLNRTGERRLAVTDDQGRLLGLLCLKRDRTGYCSDDGVAARASENERSRAG